jgi:uncharacterized protein with NAD-binding domain and iron-sulfur cluster
LAFPGFGAAVATGTDSMGKRVIILGGGVGGMSAAHELAERGFEVTVYETRSIPGGKARSVPVPGSGKRGRRDLPGEHGFRFFPGFYRHLPDTMRRIPFDDQPRGVLDNLVGASQVQMARAGGAEIISPAHFPDSLDDIHLAFQALFAYATDAGIPVDEQLHFADLLLLLLTSCQERRFAEYERQTWWTFSGAGSRSTGFQKFLADGLTRSLVAAKAKEMSARTGGYILLQLLFDLARPGGQADRVLNGPTNDVWIDPWLSHLRAMGVDYRSEHQVQAIHCRDGRISGVTVVSGERASDDAADFYVAAVPVEVMRLLASDELVQAEPRLAGLHRLRTRWMNGIMFYLDRDVPLVKGHTIYIDSPWALTSISQAQFWPRFELEEMGNGRVDGILSVDVSDWEREGVVYRKQAMYCSKEQVRDEVWAQLKQGLNDAGIEVLEDSNVITWFLDPSIVYPNPNEASNLEPLLINTAGSWSDRPDAVTAIENLFLASDYVRTHTDLATMEGANEAARRAVNGILEAAGSSAPRCGVWPLSEPEIFAPARAIDAIRFKLGRPAKQVVRVREGRVDAAPLLTVGAPLAKRLGRLRSRRGPQGT